jgi:hypothetical protein
MDTTTAVLRPLRVIVWGPSATARANTSLKCALADAAVHWLAGSGITDLLASRS